MSVRSAVLQPCSVLACISKHVQVAGGAKGCMVQQHMYIECVTNTWCSSPTRGVRSTAATIVGYCFCGYVTDNVVIVESPCEVLLAVLHAECLVQMM
jgi:hypothetical protein